MTYKEAVYEALARANDVTGPELRDEQHIAARAFRFDFHVALEATRRLRSSSPTYRAEMY